MAADAARVGGSSDGATRQITPHVADVFADVDDRGVLSWAEAPHGELRIVVPVLISTRAKQCRVDAKRNWLTVYAPPPAAVVGSLLVDAPPKEPLVDFQLYGAVDPEECHWELVDAGAAAAAVRHMVLTLRRSPVYKWPTLHRVNGKHVV